MFGDPEHLGIVDVCIVQIKGLGKIGYLNGLTVLTKHISE